MSVAAAAHSPWTPAQQRLLLGGHALAAALVLGAWAGSAGNDLLQDQIGWMDLAVLGLVVTGATAGLGLDFLVLTLAVLVVSAISAWLYPKVVI